MILVDSCVWIDLLKGRNSTAVKRLLSVQQAQTPEICVSSVIYFEVLRGIHPDLERKKVQTNFDHLSRRDYLATGFDQLVKWSLQAERQGLILKKLGDWLILKTVLDHSLSLLTSDRDFFLMQKVVPFSLETGLMEPSREHSS